MPRPEDRPDYEIPQTGRRGRDEGGGAAEDRLQARLLPAAAHALDGEGQGPAVERGPLVGRYPDRREGPRALGVEEGEEHLLHPAARERGELGGPEESALEQDHGCAPRGEPRHRGSDLPVLITGETGTGKNVVARSIHSSGPFRSAPFIGINCAALPETLIEAELFGHEKGAFTGAASLKKGLFEMAEGGTLFLDEVGELDPSLQVKLLRVLQEREFERVGGIKTIKVDVRILAATNKDLEKATREGRFREDLFYRLNVIPLHLPPLRSRTEDIVLLTAHFIQEFSRRRKREPFEFSPEAMECMLKYNWPGNVRELENLIERLSILVSGTRIQVKDLPDKFHQMSFDDLEHAAHGTPPAAAQTVAAAQASTGSAPEIGEKGIDLNEIMGTMERNMIMKALEKAGGVKSTAAQLLGLNRTTLLEKMKKMGIEMQKR